MLLVSAIVVLSGAAMADGKDGATDVVTNAFQGGQSKGVEIDVTAFGLTNNQFATFGSDDGYISEKPC